MKSIDASKSISPGGALQRARPQAGIESRATDSALIPEDTVSLGKAPREKGLWRTYSSSSASATLSLDGLFYRGQRQESKAQDFEKIETSEGDLVSWDSHQESSSNYSYSKGLFSHERGSGWNRDSWGRQYRQH